METGGVRYKKGEPPMKLSPTGRSKKDPFTNRAHGNYGDVGWTERTKVSRDELSEREREGDGNRRRKMYV